MVIGPSCLILAALTVPAFSQNAGSVEGRVASSVDHAGLAGVDVTVGSQRTTTDASGGFRVAGLTAGEQSCTFDVAGYFKSETKVRVDSGMTAARLEIELVPTLRYRGEWSMTRDARYEACVSRLHRRCAEREQRGTGGAR